MRSPRVSEGAREPQNRRKRVAPTRPLRPTAASGGVCARIAAACRWQLAQRGRGVFDKQEAQQRVVYRASGKRLGSSTSPLALPLSVYSFSPPLLDLSLLCRHRAGHTHFTVHLFGFFSRFTSCIVHHSFTHRSLTWGATTPPLPPPHPVVHPTPPLPSLPLAVCPSVSLPSSLPPFLPSVAVYRSQQAIDAAVAISAGANHVLLVHRSGQLYTWGVGASGRLGLDLTQGGNPQVENTIQCSSSASSGGGAIEAWGPEWLAIVLRAKQLCLSRAW